MLIANFSLDMKYLESSRLSLWMHYHIHVNSFLVLLKYLLDNTLILLMKLEDRALF